jgi:polyisoprenoid-binding protein YceI
MFSIPRFLLGAVAILVVAGAAATAAWWFFIREDNKLATTVPAVPAELRGTPGTSAASNGGLAFKIVPANSEADYFADEKLASLSLPSKAKGSTKDITGTFFLTPDGLQLDSAQPSKFTVNLTTLTSDKSQRDRRVQGQALDTANYPSATFTAKSVTGYDATKAAGDEQALKLTGTMDLHGVQKDITWDVKAKRDGNVVTALATVNFKFAEFNITPPNIAGFVSVQDNVTLQVQIVAQAG